MICSLHPNREAKSNCETCGALFCEGCLVDVKGKFYCKKHVAELIKNNHQSAHAHQSPHAPRYSHHYHNHYNFSDNYPYKNRLIALFLCLFLGPIGVHRFYVGKVGTGILYLFTGGLFVIGWLFDILRIVSGEFLDVNGRPLR